MSSVELLHMKEPVWIKSTTDGRCLIHHDSYYKLFPKANHSKTASARIESSKDSGEVAVAATHLIEMLLDSMYRKDMFCHLLWLLENSFSFATADSLTQSFGWWYMYSVISSNSSKMLLLLSLG